MLGPPFHTRWGSGSCEFHKLPQIIDMVYIINYMCAHTIMYDVCTCALSTMQRMITNSIAEHVHMFICTCACTGPNLAKRVRWVPGLTGPNGHNGSQAQMGQMRPRPNWAKWVQRGPRPEWVKCVPGPTGQTSC